jgi:multicomponent Na+:H+ antiporter subunit E
MKKLILLNLILTLVWVALTGSFEFINFAFGFALTFLILWVINKDAADRKYFKVIPSVIGFFLFHL